ncbi:MAG: AbrB/MazE/SpoVT family DNA-binding domain-containing protein [Candidatus Thioglobus sp.]|uniref:AbrB/MazE/SpoVT family DNA-binding domain-containing protein n=1 Tax=Candidatus Thioglobus sp. TaxID=2026721 RepID=UPI00261474A4|nr:AbrB/MazE/SpoVT family DNA-binding domain-containing protein [Candidatus Thioglobus sp.]MDC9727081.1 AbrB/MazE/SpoVT family DNA-binding domain-containing protein [Candidatus Thioglobus sp.]
MRITEKGQVTIPRDIREFLGVMPKSEVEFKQDHGKVYIVKADKPIRSNNKFKKLRGIATANMSTDEIMTLTRET